METILAIVGSYTAIGLMVLASLIVINLRDPGLFSKSDIAQMSAGWLLVLVWGPFTGGQELWKYLSETDEEYEMRQPDPKEYE